MPAFRFLPLLVLCIFFLSHAASGDFPDEISDIESWCNDTSHVESCRFYLMTRENFAAAHTEAKPNPFFRTAVELALGAAAVVEKATKLLQSIIHDDRELTPWLDCVDLFAATVFRLNQTLGLYEGPWDSTQTWLGAAFTNIQTCFNGFHDLNVTDHLLPIIEKHATNLSQLISRALAINVPGPELDFDPSWPPAPAPCFAEEEEGGYYPAWVRPGDRQLLLGRDWVAAAAEPETVVLVVAYDHKGGHYQNVSAAVDAAVKLPEAAQKLIHVKAGVYKEHVVIQRGLNNVKMVGDGIGISIITDGRSVHGGETTVSSATLTVKGDGFMAANITIRNTAGIQGGQAVALLTSSDLSVYYSCSIEGHQDTLYTHSNRQFYKACRISGTVDFIFGDSAAVFQTCNMISRSKPSGTNVVTAQGRNNPNLTSGIVIIGSNVTGEPNLNPGIVRTLLGRPWAIFSRVVIMMSYLDGLIDKAGWLEWDDDAKLRNLYYGEYCNSGPGSDLRGRVKWPGYHGRMSKEEALNFTVAKFILGDKWLPAYKAFKIPYYSGLCEKKTCRCNC